MKDDRTELACKPEPAVDLETGAILGAEVHPADEADTEHGKETLDKANDAFYEMGESDPGFLPTRAEVVADKGYHSGQFLLALEDDGWRSYVPERRGRRRRWKGRKARSGRSKRLERRAVYANRRRVRGARGKRLQRKRGELLERSFAHVLETGGMRRTWLRGRLDVAKRYLIQAAAFNLSLVMRAIFGFGKPRAAEAALRRLLRGLESVFASIAHEFLRWLAGTIGESCRAARTGSQRTAVLVLRGAMTFRSAC